MHTDGEKEVSRRVAIQGVNGGQQEKHGDLVIHPGRDRHSLTSMTNSKSSDK